MVNSLLQLDKTLNNEITSIFQGISCYSELFHFTEIPLSLFTANKILLIYNV